jgi:hypothetical protein
MRRVKKACVSSSAIPSWWSTQPSRVTLMLKVKSPMRRVYPPLENEDIDPVGEARKKGNA